MKALVIRKHGGPEVLAIEERPDPAAGPGEVRIRVRASGVNFADLMARMGLYPDAPPPPCVVGYEVAGTIMDGPRAGERVLAPTLFGGYAEQVVVPADQAIPLPDGRSFEEGATIPVNYGTAYHLLHHMGSLRRGQSVLVQAAAGGVGLAVADLCAAAGARVVGIASAAKHDFLRARGVSDLIGRDEPVAAAVKRLTGGRGVDVVLDSEGGWGLNEGYALLAPGGRLLNFGVSAMAEGERANWLAAGWQLLTTPSFRPLTLMNDNKGVLGVNMNSLAKADPGLYAAHLHALMALWADGHLKPHVDAAIPAERGAEAHRILHERRNKGKVVLTWP